MCIAIYQPAGQRVAEEAIEDSFWYNNDGGGYMYTENGQLVVKKGYMNLKPYMADLFKDIDEHPESPFVIHMRIGTHGLNNKKNTHPFLVNDNLGFVHNGIISINDIKKDESDTMAFNRLFLQDIPEELLFNDTIVKLLEHYLLGSKLIFMDNGGNVNIINEHDGHWDNGIWYSNNSYKPWSGSGLQTALTKEEDEWVDEYYAQKYGTSTGLYYQDEGGVAGHERSYGTGIYDATAEMALELYEAKAIIGNDVYKRTNVSKHVLNDDKRCFFCNREIGDSEPYVTAGTSIDLCSVDCLVDLFESLGEEYLTSE